MADPLESLREFIREGKEPVEEGDELVFGEIR